MGFGWSGKREYVVGVGGVGKNSLIEMDGSLWQEVGVCGEPHEIGIQGSN